MPASPVGTVPNPAQSPYAPGLPLRTIPEWHVARRVAQAPTADLVAEIKSLGISAWFERQLQPGTIADPLWDAFAAQRLPWLAMDYQTLMTHAGSDGIHAGGALCQALVHRPVLTTRVLQETMVTFWGDHLYVPWRSKAAAHVIAYDRDVLRPHALGTFTDLLTAAITSPALLVYLDNVENVAPVVNENLGRELLEVYTVGVGAYAEADVPRSSAILSGLGVDTTSGTFRYDAAHHVSGPVSVMGFSHPNPAGSGVSSRAPEVVTSYLSYLAHHPRTADRLARKLLRRFVSDTPSEALVQQVVKAYLDNGTAVVPMLRTIWNSEEFWGSVGQKWSRPREVIASTRRAARPRTYTPPASLEQDSWAMGATAWWYDTAGDMPRDWPMVDGYPDDAASWNGSSTLMATWNAVAGIALHWDPGSPDPAWPAVLGVNVGDNAWDVARRITFTLTGYTWQDAHVATVASMLVHLGTQAAAQTDRLNSDHLRWNLPEAVHLIMSSPYAFVR